MDFPAQIQAPDVSCDTENDNNGGLGTWSVAYRGSDNAIKVGSTYGARPLPTTSAKIVMHNAKWDIRVLERNGISVPRGQVVDTMIAAYCMGLGKQDVTGDSRYTDSGMVGGLGLKYLARRHLGMKMRTWKEIEGKPQEEVRDYNADDSISTLLLWEQWKDKLPKHFWQIDMPLLDVLMCMEDRGISLDPRKLHTYGEYLTEELKKIDCPINPYSTKQIIDYVYGQLKIVPWKFTESGQPSTEAEVLESIDDPTVKKILRYREIFKESGTYADNYIKRITPEGKIHCEFKQTSTATGRLSSSHPNLQNVPTEGEMRSLFVASAGNKLVVADKSQLELRMFAATTGDEAMLEAFRSGRNIHAETQKFLNEKGFTKIQYKDAKVLNFLMLYGGGDWKISLEFGIPREEARALIKTYYSRYKSIEPYFEQIKAEVAKTHHVVMWTGRKRRIDASYAEDWRVLRQGEREGINTPIQGGAGEVAKLEMIDLHYKHHAPMTLTVHDEIVFDVPAKDALEYAHWIKEYVPNITVINDVRFPSSVGIGDTWKEAKQKENEI